MPYHTDGRPNTVIVMFFFTLLFFYFTFSLVKGTIIRMSESYRHQKGAEDSSRRAIRLTLVTHPHQEKKHEFRSYDTLV
jgi:thiosulfate reductase cytochrome b subunit